VDLLSRYPWLPLIRFHSFSLFIWFFCSWGQSANALGLFVPVQTVVLITNVKITSFRGAIQGSLGFSSIVDVNPDVLEGAFLYDFAQTVTVDEDFGRKKRDPVGQFTPFFTLCKPRR